MIAEEQEQEWRRWSEEVMVGMTEWRAQHPRATFREIEAALDERLNRLRVRMLADVAMASAAREWQAGEEGPLCPECGTPLQARGRGKRHLQSQGGEEVELERRYGVCPACESGLFPPG